MYTAVVTRIIGNQQTTIELPCRNVTTFARTTDFFNDAAAKLGAQPFSIVIDVDPNGYAMMSYAKRKGEYVFATLHKDEA
jgi:hypothetical protein